MSQGNKALHSRYPLYRAHSPGSALTRTYQNCCQPGSTATLFLSYFFIFSIPKSTFFQSVHILETESEAVSESVDHLRWLISTTSGQLSNLDKVEKILILYLLLAVWPQANRMSSLNFFVFVSPQYNRSDNTYISGLWFLPVKKHLAIIDGHVVDSQRMTCSLSSHAMLSMEYQKSKGGLANLWIPWSNLSYSQCVTERVWICVLLPSSGY